jgi:PadR family transcriptional regulator, regulatory protein AphA
LSLKYGLLAHLSYGPMTGYDMHKRYPKPLRPTIGIIYRTLISMAKEGLVESTRVNQEKRPDRNVFSITEAGRAELMKWLTTPLHFAIQRNTVMLQVAFGRLVGKQAILNDIRSYREEMETKLKLFTDMRQWGPILKKKKSSLTVEDPYRQALYESVVDMLSSEVEVLVAMEAKINRIEE